MNLSQLAKATQAAVRRTRNNHLGHSHWSVNIREGSNGSPPYIFAAVDRIFYALSDSGRRHDGSRVLVTAAAIAKLAKQETP